MGLYTPERGRVGGAERALFFAKIMTALRKEILFLLYIVHSLHFFHLISNYQLMKLIFGSVVFFLGGGGLKGFPPPPRSRGGG